MSKDPKKDAAVAEFRNITGASQAEAVRFMKKHNYRTEIALDAYYNQSNTFATPSSKPSESATSKLEKLFADYKDPDDEETISVDGTMQWSEHLGIDLEDVAWLAVAYELKSPGVAKWNKADWIQGWIRLACTTIPAQRDKIAQLRTKLSNDPDYFRKVYLFTFGFARAEGQRSLAVGDAIEFWKLLLPTGLSGLALAHIDQGSGEGGWKPEHIDWWFEYLNEKGGKGVSKDAWNMFIDFVRQIDDKFEKHDFEEGAWPSIIDDFVGWAQEKAKGSSA